MIIDCNVTLGNWPFRRLVNTDPEAFLGLMDSLGIGQAWVAPFEAIFYNVVHEANEQLALELHGFQDRFIQLPVVNPNYPGWEDDLAECLEWSLSGFRLYPSYHAYSLQDENFLEMLTEIAAAERFVQIVVRVQDERHQHHLARVAPVDLGPLPELTRRFPQIPFIVLNASVAELRSLAEGGCAQNLLCDISHVEGIGGVGYLAADVGAEHVLFGTHGPLLYVESALLKMREADLADQARELILGGNARRMMERG